VVSSLQVGRNGNRTINESIKNLVLGLLTHADDPAMNTLKHVSPQLWILQSALGGQL